MAWVMRWLEWCDDDVGDANDRWWPVAERGHSYQVSDCSIQVCSSIILDNLDVMAGLGILDIRLLSWNCCFRLLSWNRSFPVIVLELLIPVIALELLTSGYCLGYVVILILS